MRERIRRYNRIALLLVTLICGLMLISCGPDTGSTGYHAGSIEEYSKAAVIDNIGGDLDSDLSVFPDEVAADSAEYEADFKSNLFDTDGMMILTCTYGKPQFEEEISRLGSLSKTITYGDEEYTNTVLYDEDSYSYPAYITIDGFGNTYEYALIDAAEVNPGLSLLTISGDDCLKSEGYGRS